MSDGIRTRSRRWRLLALMVFNGGTLASAALSVAAINDWRITVVIGIGTPVILFCGWALCWEWLTGHRWGDRHG